MKKVICLIVSLVVCFSAICLISACDKETKEDITTTNLSLTATIKPISTTTPLLIQQTLNNESDVGGGIMKVHKYRAMFYSVPAPFVNLVGKEVFFAWRETIDATSTAKTMVMAQFIQHFGITREQFDKANLEWAKGVRDNLDGIPCINPKDYANQITDEIFNGDIIFTFDDDLIREYYLSPDYPYLYDIEFEEAVANGEYISQTEEWVDVEQMEAEIIAKYGEAEIVTDAAEQTTSETAGEITTATETPLPEAQITPETDVRITE